MLKENGSMRSVVISDIGIANNLRMTGKRTCELRRIARMAINRFYKKHRAVMPSGVAALREELIVCVMKGISVQEAFRLCTGFEVERESLFDRVRIGEGHRFKRKEYRRKRAALKH